MITLEKLRKHWEPAVFHIYRDDFTPPNHFIALTTIEQTRIYYLLQGVWGDGKAPVVGSYEFPPRSSDILYCGNELRGGTIIAQNIGAFWATKLIEVASKS